MIFQKFPMLFLIGALVDLYLFVKVAVWIGFFPMVLLATATSILGVVLLRVQGAVLWQQLARGEMPAQALLEGGMGWLSAILLIVPGFFTDALGFVCLIPAIRRWLARRLLTNYAAREVGAARPQNAGTRTFEGHFTREKDDS
jgi:UPF0716 protein FxsA